MNRQETAQMLHIFHTAYRTEITADIESLWANVFALHDSATAADAARAWVLSEQYFPTPAGFATYVRAASNDARSLAPATHGCDGSAWIETSDKMVPCPVCNPILDDILRSPEKWQRWRDGVHPSKLTDITDVPANCVPSDREDPNDPIRRRPVKAIRL